MVCWASTSANSWPWVASLIMQNSISYVSSEMSLVPLLVSDFMQRMHMSGCGVFAHSFSTSGTSAGRMQEMSRGSDTRKKENKKHMGRNLEEGILTL